MLPPPQVEGAAPFIDEPVIIEDLESGEKVCPGVPPVSLGLRRSAGGFCVAGVGLGALPMGRMYALASLRCPLVSAALPVAFAWQARDLALER